MNIQQRLTTLERQTATYKPHGIPLKPMGWTDGEHLAVVKGLGLYGFPIFTLSNEAFIAEYQTQIEKLRADYKNGVTADKPLIQAERVTYTDTAKYLKAKYFPEQIKSDRVLLRKGV